MPIKMHVSIVKTETSAIREKVNGKRLILQKIIWRSLVRNGLRQKEKNVMLQNIVQKGIYEKVKIVRFSLKPNREKMAMRMCLSEHPFGTIKRAMGATYFLLRGLRKVTGEFALLCLGYNIERAKNLLGFEKMMEIIAGV